MAKRRPKLGDTQYRKSLHGYDRYEIQVYVGEQWLVSHQNLDRRIAIQESKRLPGLFALIIREAREPNHGT